MKQSNLSSASTLYFSRWTRKAYAMFNTLGRVVVIARVHMVLSLLSIGAVAAVAQQAQDSLGTAVQDLEEVEVNALEEPLAFSQLGRIITTISHDEIASAPVHDLAGLLSMVQGVDIRQRGGHGMQADLSMRGGTFDQVLVLLNGIPISDPQTGHFSLNVPIDIEDIDRIEVLQGPGASVFGANAYSGAVNIISKAKKENSLRLKAKGGSFASYGYGGSLNLHHKQLRALVSYTQHASDGYMDNTDFMGRNLFANTAWQHKRLSVDATLAWQQKDFGANSFYSPKFPMQYETNEARIAALGMHWNGKFKLSLVPYYRQHRDNWQLLRSKPEVYQNFHQTDVWGVRTKGYFYTILGKSTIGLDTKTEHLQSSSMGDKLDTPVSIPWSQQHDFKYAYDRQHFSVFAEQSKHLGTSWDVSLSLMMHYYHADNSFTNWYPGLHVSYTLNPKLKFVGSVSNAMRLPTFTDLFYSGKANIGNKDLVSERSWTYEVGSTYAPKAGMQYQTALFWRQGSDIIDWVWHDSVWRTENITELNTYGIEASAKWQPNVLWNLDFWPHLSLNYTYLEVSKMSSEFQSKYVSNHLRHQLNLQSGFVFFKHLHLKLNARYQSRMGNYLTYDFETQTYGEAPYKEVVLLDARLSWKQKMWEIFVQSYNLTDQKVVEYSVLQPGIWMQAGVKARILR